MLGATTGRPHCYNLPYVMHCMVSLHLYHGAHGHTLGLPIRCPHPDRSLPGIRHVLQQLYDVVSGSSEQSERYVNGPR